MRIKLSKLLKDKGFAPVLRGLLANLRGGILIEDEQGKLLLAADGGESAGVYPIRAGGEIIGKVKGGPEVEPIAALLANRAELEIERRGLVAETLHKYKEITLLYDLVEKVAACLDRREVARMVIEQARRVIRFDRMALLLLPPDGGAEILACQGPAPEPGLLAAIEAGKGILGNIRTTGQAEIINQVGADPRYAGAAPAISSMICAPLKTNEAVIGVAWLASGEPLDYTAEELKLFTTLTYQAAVAIENAALYEQLQEAFFTTVYTLAETIEKRDPYTGNHTRRVMEYSLAIGKVLDLAQEEVTRLQLAAVLHDVGKIGVRDDVLLKPGRLTDDEFARIKQHTVYGAEILRRIKMLHDIIPGVKHHHERFDGRGYPDGLAGEAIDLTARIIAVADAFDAMTTDRPYRKGLTLDEAFAELRRHAGAQFDPRLVEAFFAGDIINAYFTASLRRREN